MTGTVTIPTTPTTPKRSARTVVTTSLMLMDPSYLDRYVEADRNHTFLQSPCGSTTVEAAGSDHSPPPPPHPPPLQPPPPCPPLLLFPPVPPCDCPPPSPNQLAPLADEPAAHHRFDFRVPPGSRKTRTPPTTTPTTPMTSSTIPTVAEYPLTIAPINARTSPAPTTFTIPPDQGPAPCCTGTQDPAARGISWRGRRCRGGSSRRRRSRSRRWGRAGGGVLLFGRRRWRLRRG